MQMTREQAHEAVKTFREAYPEVVNFWRDLRDAAMDCVANHTTVRVGHVVFNGTKGLMRVRLPNGRVLNYVRPRIEQVKRTFERTVVVGEDDKGQPITEVRKETKMVPALSTRAWISARRSGARWYSSPTPGKITENLVQAVAPRRAMRGLVNAKAKGFDIILHVHDEIICEVPLDSPSSSKTWSSAWRPINWAPDFRLPPPAKSPLLQEVNMLEKKIGFCLRLRQAQGYVRPQVHEPAAPRSARSCVRLQRAHLLNRVQIGEGNADSVAAARDRGDAKARPDRIRVQQHHARKKDHRRRTSITMLTRSDLHQYQHRRRFRRQQPSQLPLRSTSASARRSRC